MKAKNDEREAARALYNTGLTYNEIVQRLQVSKSSVSLWCNDLAQAKRAQKPPKPPRERKPRQQVGEPAEGPYRDWFRYRCSYQDGIQRVQLVNRQSGERRMLSLARYKMSIKLDRYLLPGELVSRRDGNLFNDDIDNLVLTTRAEKSEANKTKHTKACVICEETFVAKKKSIEVCSKDCKYVLISMLLRDRQKG